MADQKQQRPMCELEPHKKKEGNYFLICCFDKCTNAKAAINAFQEKTKEIRKGLDTVKEGLTKLSVDGEECVNKVGIVFNQRDSAKVQRWFQKTHEEIRFDVKSFEKVNKRLGELAKTTTKVETNTGTHKSAQEEKRKLDL